MQQKNEESKIRRRKSELEPLPMDAGMRRDFIIEALCGGETAVPRRNNSLWPIIDHNARTISPQ
jgi:hypothetical protein